MAKPGTGGQRENLAPTRGGPFRTEHHKAFGPRRAQIWKNNPMSLMNWALDVAAHHPELQGALVNADGEWLDFLLPDGRTFRFRPFQMIREDAPEAERKKLLDRLISIGISGAKPPAFEETSVPSSHPAQGSAEVTATSSESDPFDGSTLTLPIVRAADYFIRTHDDSQDDSLIYIPLTDFVGVGLARDTPENIVPLYFSDLGLDRSATDLGAHFGESVSALRQLNYNLGKRGLELGVTREAGARVMIFTGPPNYESSWFADLDLIQAVARSLSEENPETFPLFIPATRSRLLIVMANDPYLPNLFRTFRQTVNQRGVIYPLPHTVAADGWAEWIPLPDDPSYPILSELRGTFRERIYRNQKKYMQNWPNQDGTLAAFSTHEVQGRTITTTRWLRSYEHGSIPGDAEYVSFTDDAAPAGSNSTVTIRLDIARDVWPEGIRPAEGIWPPRYEIRQFPDAATMEALRQASDRRF